MTKIVSATLYCDRKPEYTGRALKPLLESKLIDSVYINIQTDGNAKWFPMLDWAGQSASAHKKTSDTDMWHISSTWRKPAKYDQDQTRVKDIVLARNMAIDYAIAHDADYLLFIDSDVIIANEDIQTLLDMKTDLCGGLVYGRGVHRENPYVFGEVGRYGPIIHCVHGTCGYMLISRNVFESQNFRYGWDQKKEHFLSEDPAFCQDWYIRSGQYYQIHTEVRAIHWDDPFHPLTEEGVARDEWKTIRN